MKLSEIMSPADTSFGPADKLVDIIKSLAESASSCKVICEQGVPVGIVTEEDMVRLFSRHSESGVPAELNAAQVMTSDPIMFTTDMELAEAIALFRSRDLHHLPVVNAADKLVGIVTLADVMKAYLTLSEKHNELEVRSEQLQCLSMEDYLTELPNRRAMEKDLAQAEARGQRYGETYCVTLIDIDFFKAYNDYYGHLQGDEALRTVAGALKTSARQSDKAFRYGGEEFLYYLPSSSLEDGIVAAQRLCNAVSLANVEHDKSPHGYLTISVGVAFGCQGPWQDVIQHADEALYQAKEEGRNCVCVSTDDQAEPVKMAPAGKPACKPEFS